MSSNKTRENKESASPRSDGHTPQVFLHSITDQEVAEKIREIFRELGWQAWSESESQGFGPERLGELLLEHEHRSAGSMLLVIDATLDISKSAIKALEALMGELMQGVSEARVLTALSNACQELNPFAGLTPASTASTGEKMWEGLVSLLGPGQTHTPNIWPRHLLFFNPEATRALAKTDLVPANAMARLEQQAGRLLVADTLFIPHPRCGMFDQAELETHEQRRPVAWGLLMQRLDQWLRSDLTGFSEYQASGKVLTLHITHSWGGGVAQWVESFIDSDQKGLNLQLRSEGPQSGEGAGQRLSLYYGNKTDTAIASWWLQPPIRSTAREHAQYRAILLDITRRYAVGRIIVSSLVGHSLDALGCGLPTVQVLHDFYPCWPLLGIHPGPYLEDADSGGLNQALTENQLLPDFADRDAKAWQALAQSWHEAVSTWAVKLVAPSQSVAEMLRRLDPAWADALIEIIPHGLPPMSTDQEVQPREREDGRIRLVIPGRMQQGKGRDLLLEALPELTRYAQIYLVGAGQEGEAFFGQSGVDVILQYRRDELPAIMARIGPHVAALLSVVPETFSYTLSEMQQLNIPVVATRVGSLEERILDDETGWLIEPAAAALVEIIKRLSEDRDAVETMHSRLADFSHPDAIQMVGQYDQLCMPRPGQRQRLARLQPGSEQLNALAIEKSQVNKRLRELNRVVGDLQLDIEERTQWAEERQRALEEEQDLRDRHVTSLNQQLDVRYAELEAARQAFFHEQSAHDQTRQSLELRNAQYDQLKATHDWVLASSSWRITRPFRVARRILSNFVQAQAWNPLRWPLLLSQFVRTLKTLGWQGTLARSQLSHQKTFAPESYGTEQLEEVGNPDAPDSFPIVPEPTVSIIIPAFNKWVYTAACLRSLAEISCRTSFEVIVVDDQSSDETGARLSTIGGLTTISNKQNLGFIGSCNKGAEQARGQFVVMLNNDTQVLDGWLDALLHTFRQFPDTGLAGARLIYPDGRLQESGGIIFNDGSGWNYGRDDDADKPEYLYVREVDYCSGACIMLKSEVFSELNGFDEHYSPAYYEDTDLAFRVRQMGLKVRVQPRSTIVHHEGVTSGTDIASGTKRYQAVNRDKFLQRWREELPAYPAPLADPTDCTTLRSARDHRLKGRILVIDAYTPEPDQDSGSLRLRYLLDCMTNLGYGVTFFAENRGHSGVYTTDLQQSGVEVFYNPWLDSLHRFFKERGPDFAFVMISRHYVAANYISLLERYCPNARFIFDTVDLHYLRETRLAELEDSLPLKRVAAQTRRSELAVIEAADATLVVSPVEKSVLEKDAPEARVHVISNVHKVVGSRKAFSERKDIFFVGGYQHPPNVDAAIWFVTKIWPLVREQLPDMQFHLIGSKATEQISSLHGNGVQFHGFVKSLEPWLDNCRLAVAPLRYGAGVKGKVNISMSRGQPVVATPMAVEGMFVTSGEEVLVAETAEEFADAIVRLYQHEQLWEHISNGGLENVKKYFSVETASNSLKELLKGLS